MADDTRPSAIKRFNKIYSYIFLQHIYKGVHQGALECTVRIYLYTIKF